MAGFLTSLLMRQRPYVEVKPIDRFPDRGVIDKIDNSGCAKEVLIVGSTVPIHGGLIGWLRQDMSDVTDSDESYWIWAGGALGIWIGTEKNNDPRHKTL